MKKILFPVLLTTLLIGCGQAPAPSDPSGPIDPPGPIGPINYETRDDFYNAVSALGTYQYQTLDTTFSMEYAEDGIVDPTYSYTSSSKFAYEDGAWVLKEGDDTPYDFTNDYTAKAYLLYYEGDSGSEYISEEWTYQGNPLKFTYINQYQDEEDESVTESTIICTFNEKGYLLREDITYFTTNKDESTTESKYVYTYSWSV